MQKKCYVVYFRNLQQALDHEMKFTKVIKFSQKEWCLKQNSKPKPFGLEMNTQPFSQIGQSFNQSMLPELICMVH